MNAKDRGVWGKNAEIKEKISCEQPHNFSL